LKEHLADLRQHSRLSDVIGAHDHGDRANPTERVRVAAVADADPFDVERKSISIACDRISRFSHGDDRTAGGV
jgi:hypothetical protein